MVRLSSSLFIALVLLTSSNAYAQEFRQGHLGSREQQRACRPDVLRHCRELMEQSDYAIAGCLRSHVRVLSPACREELQQADRR